MKNEKIKNILSKINTFTLKYGYIIEFIISIFLSISIYKIYTYKTYYEYTSVTNIIIAIFSIIILAYIIILNLIKNIKKLEKMFLTFMIPIGIMFTILMIPGFVADEPAHMYRAYDIQQGNIIAPVNKEGTTLTTIPKALNLNDRSTINSYKLLMDKVQEKTDYNDTEDVWCPAQGYNAIMYIFSSIAFLIGRLFSLNVFITIYLARIFNFIFFLFAGYYIIKLLLFGKLVFLVYMFNPMLIHQSASVSADSIINSVTLFFIGYSLYLAFKQEKITKANKILYCISAIMVSLAKYVYFPLVLLSVLFINSKKNKNKKLKLHISILVIICILLTIISFIIGSRYSSPAVEDTNISMIEQTKNILMHPLQYIKVLTHTMVHLGEYYFMGFNGKYLGWININVNSMPIIIYSLVLASTIILEKNKISLNIKQKILFIFIFLVVLGLVFTGMYMGCTEVGADIILGVQGRYFIPVAILLLLCLISKDKYVEYKYSTIIYFILLVFINLSALNTVRLFFLI